MDKQAAKLMETLRKDPMYELYDDTKLAALAEEIVRDLMDYEASIRPAGTHWPEDLIVSVLGLKWAELKESAEEEISELLDTLTPRERKVIELFYKEEKGLLEIAEEFNVSHMTIRSVLAQGTGKLRHPARAKRLAALVEKADKDPVIRGARRTLERWPDDTDTPDTMPDTPDTDDDIFKSIFDDSDD